MGYARNQGICTLFYITLYVLAMGMTNPKNETFHLVTLMSMISYTLDLDIKVNCLKWHNFNSLGAKIKVC